MDAIGQIPHLAVDSLVVFQQAVKGVLVVGMAQAPGRVTARPAACAAAMLLHG